jgi:hypothetical protein
MIIDIHLSIYDGGFMKTTFSVVFGIIATTVIVMGIGNHGAYAAKLTASSNSDGYSRGVKDASRGSSSPLVTIKTSSSVSKAADMMLQYNVRHY